LVPEEGGERARGADEQEEKRDARERVSPEPCRKGRSPGWAEAQAGESLLRHSRINENGRGTPSG